MEEKMVMEEQKKEGLEENLTIKVFFLKKENVRKLFLLLIYIHLFNIGCDH